MSASLVGSEMCIRDSGSRCPRPFSPACVRHPVRRPASGCLAVRQVWSGCLLYTSDAADDM
eukprot:12551489-Alexandrium_andersonii.AAC.1